MGAITAQLRRVKRVLAPRLKDAASEGAYRLGAYSALAPRYAGAGLIFMLHRVCPDDHPILYPGYMVPVSLVDRLLGFVRSAGWDIVGLSDIRSRLLSPGSRRFACFTFDDGYADNYTLALPVFRRHGAPMAVYVVTGMLDRSINYWWGALEALVLRQDEVEVPALDNLLARRLPARTLDEKRRAHDALDELAHQFGERFLAAVEPLWRRAGVDPVALLERDALSVSDARALAADPLVTIGAHTLTHARLSTLPAEAAWIEISQSGTALEDALAVPVRHFAYPFGGANSCGAREFEMSQRVGFETAVTTRRGNLFHDHLHHLHALPRRNVPLRRRDALNALYGLESLRRGEPVFQTS